nr:MAG TPA: hypothetical protein [Caudoviricetes sp.]
MGNHNHCFDNVHSHSSIIPPPNYYMFKMIKLIVSQCLKSILFSKP